MSASEIYDDGVCQGLWNTYPSAKLLVAVIYRPPDASLSSFANLLEQLGHAIEDLADTTYDLFITGDFNLPNVDWESLDVRSGGTSESNLSAQLLLNFMSTYLLSQMVNVPTRGQNILDLVLCNQHRLVTDVKTEPTDLSDHDMVNVLLSFQPGVMEDAQTTYLDEMNFRSLDFNRADFTELNKALGAIDWKELKEEDNFEEFPAKFTEQVLSVCLAIVPRKRPPTGKPRLYNSLRRRKGKLKIRLAAAVCAGDANRIKELEDEIGLVSYEIKEAVVHHLEEGERRAVERIKTNPKYFFSYAKSFSKVKQTISTLLNDRQELVTDQKEMANILQQQFCSVFSNPNHEDTSTPAFTVPPIVIVRDEFVDIVNPLALFEQNVFSTGYVTLIPKEPN